MPLSKERDRERKRGVRAPKSKSPPPVWVTEAPRPFQGKAAQSALQYMAYIAKRGYTLERETGELLDLLPGWGAEMEAQRRELRATQMKLASLQVDISLQRAEAILAQSFAPGRNDQRRELLEEEP